MLGKRERRGQDRKEGYRRREDYGGGVGLAIVAALEKKNAAVKIVTMTPAPPLMISFSSVGRLFFGVDEEEDEGPSRNVGLPFAHRRRGSSELPCTKTSDFLSSCFLCKKKLHGVDIYMYRGEKAFCSMECRGQEMIAEQLQEKCSSVLSTDYRAGQLF